MATPADDRLRPHPSEREASSKLALDLNAALLAIRQESIPARSGHRQISLLHRGPVRIVLFDFATGGRLREHSTPGIVTIHVLTGEMHVEAGGHYHDLSPGQILILDPEIPHDVEAVTAGTMLLTIHLDPNVGSGIATL